MSAFNPWLGFPARNAIYLDRDFDRQRGNGQAAFGTFQTAYNAAVALAISTGETVLIYVGEGTAAQLGSLILTAAWDSRVILVGVSRDVSKVGTITATNGAGDGFAVPLTFADITVGAITSNGAAGFNGGAVTLIGNGIASTSVGSITSTADTNGGAVTLTDVFQSGSIDTTGDAQGGNVSLVRSFSTGTITVDSAGGPPGTVSLDEQSTCGNISSEAAGDGVSITVLDGSTIGSVSIGAGAGNMAFTIKNGSKASNVGLGGNNVTAVIESSVILDFTAGNGDFTLTARDAKMGAIINPNSTSDIIKMFDCMIDPSGVLNSIEKLGNGAVFVDVVMRTNGGNAPCIGTLAGVAGTTQFIDCTLIPNGTGVAISAAPGTGSVICDNLRMKNDSPSVDFTGQYTVNPGYAFPG